jgi:hypothetical protein
MRDEHLQPDEAPERREGAEGEEVAPPVGREVLHPGGGPAEGMSSALALPPVGEPEVPQVPEAEHGRREAAQPRVAQLRCASAALPPAPPRDT